MRRHVMSSHSSSLDLPERLPEVGELVQVRSRRWLVEEVIPADSPDASTLVRLAAARATLVETTEEAASRGQGTVYVRPLLMYPVSI